MQSKAFLRMLEVLTSASEDSELIDSLTYSGFYSRSYKAHQNKEVPSLGKNAPDWHNLLKDPPANSSVQTKKELEIIKRTVEKSRSPKVVEKILIADRDMNYLFLKAAGVSSFSDYENQIIETLYKHILPVVINLKNKFDRPRPYQIGGVLDVPIEHINTSTHHTPAYPSGHAAYGAMMARILSYTRPEKSQEFYEVQNEIAEARVQQGVHYPSDNLASFILVETIWKFFKNNVLKD